MRLLDPLLLAVSLLSIGVEAKKDACDELGENIQFRSHSFDQTYEVYMNNRKNEMYIMHVWRDLTITIKSLETQMSISISDSGAFKFFQNWMEKMFYVFTFMVGSRKHLAIGFLVEEEWCRHDVDMSSTDKKNISRNKKNPKPDVTYFHWSKKNIQVHPVIDGFNIYVPKEQDTVILAEYISVGSPKVIMDRYHHFLRLRTPIGGHIATIRYNNPSSNFDEFFLQPIFIVHLLNKNNKERIFRVGETDAENWSWMFDNESSTHVNYFTAKSPTKNCYWRRIPNETPNNCLYLKKDDILATKDKFTYFFESQKLNAVVMYRNVKDPRLSLRCYKIDDTYFLIVTNQDSEHVITTGKLDCSSSAGIDDKLVVALTGLNKKEVVIVGARETTEDEWCSYSIIKYHSHAPSFKGGKTFYGAFISVYYGFVPEAGMQQWTQIYEDKLCSGITATDITTSVSSSLPSNEKPVARYLSINKSARELLVLECYLLDGKPYALIKTMSKTVKLAIHGFPCTFKTDLDSKSYVVVAFSKGTSHVFIGTRQDPQLEFCSYTFEWNVPGAVAQFHFDRVEFSQRQIVWSEASVAWERLDNHDYGVSDIARNYVTQGGPTFYITSFKQNQRRILSNPSGTHLAVLQPPANSDPWPASADIFTQTLVVHFLANSPDKYEFIDCSGDCRDKILGDQEIFVFYFPNQPKLSQNDFHFDVKRFDIFQWNNCWEKQKDFIHAGYGSGIGTRTADPDFILYSGEDNEGFQLRCYKDGENYKSTIGYKSKIIFTWTNLDCSDPQKIKEFFIYAQVVDGDFLGFVLGRKLVYEMQDADTPKEKKDSKGNLDWWNKLKITKRKDASGEKKLAETWCWYTVIKTPSRAYFLPYRGEEPRVLDHQWYKAGTTAECSTIKKNSITFTDLWGSEAKTYSLAYGRENIIIKCALDASGNVLGIIPGKTLSNISIKLGNNMDCTQKTFFEKFYIFIWESSTKPYLAIGVQEANNKWCRLDVCLRCSDALIRVNNEDEKPSITFEISEPGIVLNSRPRPNHNLVFDKLVSVSKTTMLSPALVTRCIFDNNQYQSEITSTRGITFGSFTGHDCTKKWFHKVHVSILNNNEEVFSTDLNMDDNLNDDNFCWYFGCNKPASDDQGTVIIFFFYKTDGTPSTKVKKKWRSKKWLKKKAMLTLCVSIKEDKENTQAQDGSGGGEEVTTEVFDTSIDWQILWKSNSPTSPGVPGSILKPQDIHIATDIRDTAQMSLVAKYEQNDAPVQLLCYKSNDFYSVVTDKDGNKLVGIADKNCAPNPQFHPTEDIPVGFEWREVEKFVFVRNENTWYSYCVSCVHLVPVFGYTATPIRWVQVPIMDGCSLKSSDFSFNDDIPLETQGKIAQYNEEKDQYMLYCYDINSERKAVLKQAGTYVATVKGLDCSSQSALESTAYFTETDDDDPILTVGTETFLPESGRWQRCLFYLESAKVVPVMYRGREKLKWRQAMMDCPVKRSNLNLDESVNAARMKDEYLQKTFISDVGNYRLSCYHQPSEYLAVFRRYDKYVMDIAGFDCTSADYVNSNIYMSAISGPTPTTPTVGGKGKIQDAQGKELDVFCLYIVDLHVKTMSAISYKGEPGFQWFQVHDNYPLKKENIRLSSSEGDLTDKEDKIEKRYISDNGVYFIHCYQLNTKFVAAIYERIIETYITLYLLAVIEDIDCTTRETLNSKYQLRIYKGGKIMTVYLKDENSNICWVYDLLHDGTVVVDVNSIATCNSRPTSARQWSQAWNLPENPASDDGLVDGKETTLVALYKRQFKNPDPQLGLECHKMEVSGTAKYFVKLKGPREQYIVTVPYPLDCTDPHNLIRKAFLHVEDRGRHKILPEVSLAVIERLHQEDDLLKNNDIRFYFFENDGGFAQSQYSWVPISQECPKVARKSITKNPTTQGWTKVSTFRDWGSNELNCYEQASGSTGNKLIAVIDMKKNNQRLQIDGLDCRSRQGVDQIIHVDGHDGHTVFGSRPSADPRDKWCWYIIPNSNSHIIKVFDDEHKKITPSHWYTVDEEDCPKVKGKDISKVEDPEKEKFENLKIVHEVIERTASESFLLFCYEKDGNYHLTINLLEPISHMPEMDFTFVASVSGFDCSWKDNVYVHMLDDDRNVVAASRWISFGTYDKDWCQIDICFYCRLNNKVITGLPKPMKNFDWILDAIVIKETPSLKNQKSLEFLNNAQSKITKKTYYYSKYKDSINFFMDCYTVEVDYEKTLYAVLRTGKGLIIQIMKDIDFTESIKVAFRYISIKKNDGERSFIGLDSNPPDPGEGSCWFYGCATQTNDEFILFRRSLPPQEQLDWKLYPHAFDGDKGCPRLDSTWSLYQHTDYEVLIKHKYTHANLGGKVFTLRCHVKSSKIQGDDELSTEDYVLEVWDSTEENHIATIRAMPDCHSTVAMFDSFGIYIENDRGNAVTLQILDIKPPQYCGRYSLVLCEQCTVKSWRYYKTHTPNADADWENIVPEYCNKHSRETIFVSEEAGGLGDYPTVYTYISSGDDENLIMVMYCYKSADNKFGMRIYTLKGEYVVTILNYDCSSPETFSNFNRNAKHHTFYTSAVEIDGRTQFVFFTPLLAARKLGIWCYTKITTTGAREIKTHILDERLGMESIIPSWSLNGLSPQTDPKIAEDDKKKYHFSRHENIANPEFKLDCYKTNRQEGPFLTVMTGPNNNMYSEFGYGCEHFMKLVYLYTLYKDGSYDLVRFDQPYTGESSVKTVKSKTLFIFKNNLNSQEMTWKLVKYPKLSWLDTPNYDPSKEVDECFPKDASLAEPIEPSPRGITKLY